jgi:hypothetical protein
VPASLPDSHGHPHLISLLLKVIMAALDTVAAMEKAMA